MRQMSEISGHPIFTGFCRLMGCQRDPRDRGVTIFFYNDIFEIINIFGNI